MHRTLSPVLVTMALPVNDGSTYTLFRWVARVSGRRKLKTQKDRPASDSKASPTSLGSTTARRSDRIGHNTLGVYATHVEGRGEDLYQAVCEQNLEGIVAKRKNGTHRKAGWLKIKNPNYTQAQGRKELFE